MSNPELKAKGGIRWCFPKAILLRRRGVLFGSVGILLACSGVGLAQSQTAKEHGGSPLMLNKTEYRLRAGESIKVDVPRNSFLCSEKCSDPN